MAPGSFQTEPFYVTVIRFISIVGSFAIVPLIVPAKILAIRERGGTNIGFDDAFQASHIVIVLVIAFSTVFSNLCDEYGQRHLRLFVRVAVLSNLILVLWIGYQWYGKLILGAAANETVTVSLLALALINLVSLRLKRITERLDRRWCAKCGYDLRGSDSPYCPECGQFRRPAP